MCAFQIARTAQFQVGLGYAETIVGIAHDVDTFAGVFAQFEGGDEDAERLIGATTHTTAELVQLGQAEALGLEDDHHRCVRNIHTHLDDRGGHKYLSFTTYELLHLFLFVLRFHTSVYLA